MQGILSGLENHIEKWLKKAQANRGTDHGPEHKAMMGGKIKAYAECAALVRSRIEREERTKKI